MPMEIYLASSNSSLEAASSLTGEMTTRPPNAAPKARQTLDSVALRSRVFEFVADHPDGTRLTEIEEDMRVGRYHMSRVLRTLIDENKVEKRGLLYFAI